MSTSSDVESPKVRHSGSPTPPSVKYAETELNLLKTWRDKAGGWRWLHYHSMHLYKKINARFTYSSIVLSTLAGAGGFSTAGNSGQQQNTVEGQVQFYMGYIIGATNVVIGLINSFQRFGKAAEKTELHASAAMQYAMLYRLLETEIHLTDEHRRNDLISTIRQEMDRLLAQSPAIPQKIVDAYNREFPNIINKPDVCNGMGGEDDEAPSEVSKSRFNQLITKLTG
jgi:hypothetical protein